ncbi:MAG TPA: esterase-like activity of phytase family protein, partial [Salinimicrobium sp.]|nr:esterase-like activity of phytase family protein [Salinimicrobium sp.]
LPEVFLAESAQQPRNNGVFEGLAESFDGKGYWAALELPLKADGPKPKLIRTKSPVRITFFDKRTKEATRQFPYIPEPIAKIPWLYFAINGVTDILEYAPNQFLVLERGFVAGHGQNGNTVRIFDVNANLATNTLDQKNLKVSFYNPAKKELIYDFKWAIDYLSQGFIDNIEGFTFGPILPNGKQSLLLISDNNFNSLGKQINQVILMELELKN